MMDWTIHLGDLLQVGGFVTAALTLFAYMRVTLENHSVRLGGVEEELKQQTTILLQLAKDGVRLDALERRLELVEQRVLTSNPPKL